MPALHSAGVSCFKIEGRKKSPLYVATTTDYYRKLLDGTLQQDDRPEHEGDMQTVFSRPWTRLFVQSHKDKEVADRDTVGHRGTAIGRVEAVLGGVEPRLRFRTERALERHDGLQIDLPTLGKPLGFAVDRLWLVDAGRKGQNREVFEGPTQEHLSKSDCHETIRRCRSAQRPVYCSSSQAVKQKYRFEAPKAGLHRIRHAVEIKLVVTPAEVTATGRIGGEPPIECCSKFAGPFAPAKDAAAMQAAARGAFEKLGQTRLELGSFRCSNDAGQFVPVSRLNQVRRQH